MATAQVNGRAVAYTDEGSGPAVVLLHGLIMDRTIWEGYVSSLSSTHRVITIDAPGHGDSDPAAVGYDFADLAAETWTLLDQISVDSAIFGGQSMGGWTALRCNELRPEATSGLILTDTSVGVESPELKPQYEAFLQVALESGVSDDLAGVLMLILFSDSFAQSQAGDEWRKKLTARDPASYEALARAVFDRPDVEHLLAGVRCPAIVLHGEDDIAIEMSRAEQLSSALNAPLHRIPGAGHAAVYERFDLAYPPIRSFLDSLG